MRTRNTASKSGSMILTAALMHGLGNQGGAWRVRKGEPTDHLTPDSMLSWHGQRRLENSTRSFLPKR